jgi:hypothetical protein
MQLRVSHVRRASALIVVGLALLLGGAQGALGEAAAGTRLALVDGAEQAQLQQELRVALQPWAIEVFDWPWPGGAPASLDGAPPAPLDAAAMAETSNARYVVWYDAPAAQLVVYDAGLRHEERRELAALPADELEASAVALSIKTMLRLSPVPSGAPTRSGWAPWLRVGPRFGLDGDGGAQLRAQLGIDVVVAALAGVRLGVLGDLGTSTSVSGGGFSGSWSEWSAMATVGRDVELAPWTLTAQAAFGLSRGALGGEAMKQATEEGGNQLGGQVLLGAGRQVGPFMIGGEAGLTARGAQRYLRANGQPLWEEPSLLLSVLATLRLAL